VGQAVALGATAAPGFRFVGWDPASDPDCLDGLVTLERNIYCAARFEPADRCPQDPDKTDPGGCGCGEPDLDSDSDGTLDCLDDCPEDAAKTGPGACGCGEPDTDSDTDETPDCIDNCPNDPGKVEPGACGCGAPDTDSDSDGALACFDCDDGDPEVHPGAEETPDNGKDDDCDAETPDSVLCWAIEDLDLAAVRYISIAVDSEDRVHISYVDDATQTLKYATNASSVWAIEVVDGGVAFYTSIGLDSLDHAHISYYDAVHGDLKYATNAAGGWIAETVASVGDVGRNSSIAVDSAARVHISYADTARPALPANLSYATNASGVWLTEVVDPDNLVGQHSSIAVDSRDEVHIGYDEAIDPTEIRYATRDPFGNWIIDVAATDTSGGGPIAPAIALDSFDNVHIGYVHIASLEMPSRGEIRHATNSSGPWTGEAVDAVPAAQLPSLALDHDENLHMAYIGDFGELRYATNAAGIWYTTIVDLPGLPGAFNAVAVDSRNRVHLSYGASDGASAGLRYATDNVDEDGDGSACGRDCNDRDASVYPGAPELCDEADNDCDDEIDEGHGVGARCEAVGECEAGRIECSGDGGVVCSTRAGGSADQSETELCDGLDNDCNGVVDDGFEVGAPCEAVGECDGGVIECGEDGEAVCSTHAGGSADQSEVELCDGLDNDCNGVVDDGFEVAATCEGVGACGAGRMECAGDAGAICSTDPGGSADQSQPERCDGLDNDCDGSVDEGFAVGGPCDGVGACGAGRIECGSDGATICSTDPGGSADQSRVERCDGLDNDCDGTVDEVFDIGAACEGSGECGAGVIECARDGGTICSTHSGGSADQSRAELCDGLDNDCDGAVDDGFEVGTTCDGVGACGQGVIECAGDGSAICSTDRGGSADQGQAERCDGLDNDCNGTKDDGCQGASVLESGRAGEGGPSGSTSPR
jgi:hypothetical protein